MGKYDYELEEWFEDDDFYTPEELSLVRSALEGNGQTNDSTFMNAMGVMIPEEFELYIWGMADAFNIKRGHDEADIFGCGDDELYGDDRTCRMEQSDINTVTSWMADNGVYPKLLAYLNGASWEESGMSDYNGDILRGWTTIDSRTAETMFIYYYMRNQGGDDGYEGVMYQKYGSLEGIMFDSNLPWDADEANEILRKRWYLIEEAKRQMLDQLTPVTTLLGISDGEEPTPILEITDEDYDIVSSNYYTDQIKTYNTNYNQAIEKINNMITKLTSLYDSFTGASGSDISKMKNDISTLINDLNTVKTTVQSKKTKTNENADACQRCFVNWNTKYGKASINSEGIIYRIEITGEDDEQEKTKLYATIEEMLNS